MRVFQKIGIACFVAALIVPSVLWFGFLSNNSENLENRTLAQFPDFTNLGWSQVFPALEEWYEDNVPFKNDAVRIKNTFTAAVFGEVQSDRVIYGDDGWLFYKSQSDGDPLGEYKGTISISDEQMQEYAEAFVAAQENLEAQGIELYVLAAPNKEIVYSEYMPGEIKVIGESTRACKLESYLSDAGIGGFRYLLDEEVEQDIPTYYCLDIHWNYYGAYLGYLELLDMMGMEPLNEPTFEVAEKSGGDLASMLNLVVDESNSVQVQGERNYVVDDSFETSIEVFESSCDDADSRTMLIISDSFRGAFKGFAAEDFSKVVALHRSDYDSDEFRELDVEPDVIVLLSPERYIMENLAMLKKLADY